MFRTCKTALWLSFACIAWHAQAAPLPGDDAERACWLSHSRERTRIVLNEPTGVAFSNLRSGMELRTPFRIDFAVRGMGVAPAGKAKAGTGHHHVLVDTPLPLDVAQKIPFSDTHRHFGKGQTSTLLELPPGRHTLRLLFADHDHRPYFVYSPEIVVQVKGARSALPRPAIDPKDFDASCAAWYAEERSRPRTPGEPLYVENLRANETLASPFNVRLGVEGFGVSARGLDAENAGHFMLEVLARADRRVVQSFDLSNGATQANLFVAVGSYWLRLRFVAGDSGRDLLPAHELPITVGTQERL